MSERVGNALCLEESKMSKERERDSQRLRRKLKGEIVEKGELERGREDKKERGEGRERERGPAKEAHTPSAQVSRRRERGTKVRQ